MTTTWAIVMTLMGVVQSYGGLLAARLALGVAEAGLFPVSLLPVFKPLALGGGLCTSFPTACRDLEQILRSLFLGCRVSSSTFPSGTLATVRSRAWHSSLELLRLRALSVGE